MKLNLEMPGGIHIVRGYSSDGVRINDRLYAGSVIVTAGSVIEHWPPRSVEELTQAHLDQALALKPEGVRFGPGRTQKFPPRDLLGPRHASRRGFEIMDTGAACRPYNVLGGERRTVAAALIVERD